MATLLGILAMMAFGVGVIGWLWITVLAFTEGEVLWGIGCLIISPLCLVYAFLNFDEMKIPFLMVVGGFVSRVAIGVLTFALG
ncbi:MAG: hypothetical protein WBD31_22465 [Rubripirellula sp.]